MLKVITDPVETKIREFYHERNEETRERLRLAREKAGAAGAADDQILNVTVIPMRLRGPEIERVFGQPEIECEQVVNPTDYDIASKQGAFQGGADQNLKGMGVMEAFMVYIKVSLLCGVILACPWLFYQMWAFIGAGLYPHEKKLVHYYLPFSVFLFITGCLICQFLVLPKAVEAMLSFYKWINIDPDLRLNEWLGFAIVMPLVFGISFQTPLVMVFLNRIGLFGWEVYLAKWRYAMFILACLSAVLTPSVDVISMLWLFVPTFGLYMLGVLLCYLMPPPNLLLGPVEEEEVGV
jgi:sec-independent protein translocase protein TatC